MEKICNDYRRISKFAKACGFDGVLVHGGHGFNIQQFISPWTNHRTDEFGGSMENRARFPKMILEAVREGIGEDMILELRMSAEDGVDGGMEIRDMVEFCREIDGMADIIHVSNGLKWAGNQTQTFSDFFDVHGVNVEFAAKVKAAVTKSKVAVIGGINDPAFADQVIRDGKADFIELGRQGFADPEFPNKAFSGGKTIYVNASDASPATPASASTKPMFPSGRKDFPRKRLTVFTVRRPWGAAPLTRIPGLDGMKTGIPIPKEAGRCWLWAAA